MAQATRVLDRGSGRLGISDENAFLFGNLVPDIYVGYMVHGLSVTLPYSETHMAVPEHIPVPRSDEFWQAYIEGSSARGAERDVALGAWAHLAADRLWNMRVRAFAADRRLEPGDELRIRKQRDFDVYGRTLRLDRRLVLSNALVDAAARFPQYPIDSEAVEKTVVVANGIVSDNRLPEGAEASFSLLDEEFFERTFEESVEQAIDCLEVFMKGM